MIWIPAKVEEQARLIANAPKLATFANRLVDWARKSGEDMPNALAEPGALRRKISSAEVQLPLLTGVNTGAAHLAPQV